MAKLRLFANLREIAGASKVDLPGRTVGEVIEAASDEFGPEFRRSVETARVWVNGVTVAPGVEVAEDDEVVLIPPVSGGSQRAPTLTASDAIGLFPLAVALVAVLANFQGQELWVAALVAIAAVWAMDLGTAFERRGRYFAPLAVVTTSAVSAMGAHILGGAGYALSLGVAVLVGLGWAVFFPVYRRVDVFSPLTIVTLFAGLGTASLLARSAHSPEPQATDVFLVSVIVACVLGAVVERMPAIPLLDPFSVTAIAAVLAAMGAAAVWDLDVVGYLLIGLGITVALVAGRGFSSMLRSGRVVLTERPPGNLVSLDGVVLAAAVLYPLLVMVF